MVRPNLTVCGVNGRPDMVTFDPADCEGLPAVLQSFTAPRPVTDAATLKLLFIPQPAVGAPLLQHRGARDGTLAVQDEPT